MSGTRLKKKRDLRSLMHERTLSDQGFTKKKGSHIANRSTPSNSEENKFYTADLTSQGHQTQVSIKRLINKRTGNGTSPTHERQVSVTRLKKIKKRGSKISHT